MYDSFIWSVQVRCSLTKPAIFAKILTDRKPLRPPKQDKAFPSLIPLRLGFQLSPGAQVYTHIEPVSGPVLPVFPHFYTFDHPIYVLKTTHSTPPHESPRASPAKNSSFFGAPQLLHLVLKTLRQRKSSTTTTHGQILRSNAKVGLLTTPSKELRRTIRV